MNATRDNGDDQRWATSGDDRRVSHAIADALESLGKDTGGAIAYLRQRATVTRRLVVTAIVVAVATAATLAVAIASLLGVRSSSTELEDVQRRTSDQVLCPLYGIFIQSAKNPPPPQYTAEQRAQRLEAIRVIEQGARTLGCNFGEKK